MPIEELRSKHYFAILMIEIFTYISAFDAVKAVPVLALWPRLPEQRTEAAKYNYDMPANVTRTVAARVVNTMHFRYRFASLLPKCANTISSTCRYILPLLF
jgi:hypothetical protein